MSVVCLADVCCLFVVSCWPVVRCSLSVVCYVLLFVVGLLLVGRCSLRVAGLPFVARCSLFVVWCLCCRLLCVDLCRLSAVCWLLLSFVVCCVMRAVRCVCVCSCGCWIVGLLVCAVLVVWCSLFVAGS